MVNCDLCKKFIHPTEVGTAARGSKEWRCSNCRKNGHGAVAATGQQLDASGSAPLTASSVAAIVNDLLEKHLSASMAKINVTLEQLNVSMQAMTDRVSELENENLRLRAELEGLKERGLAAGGANDVLSAEHVIAEIVDRDKRKENLIVFGLPEVGETGDARRSADVESMGHILSLVGVTADEIKPVRLGKFVHNSGRIRPIKISLKCSTDVATATRNGKQLKGHQRYSSVYICRDRTPLQLKLYGAVRKELINRKANGETGIRIKYINEVPVIVSEN